MIFRKAMECGCVHIFRKYVHFSQYRILSPVVSNHETAVLPKTYTRQQRWSLAGGSLHWLSTRFTIRGKDRAVRLPVQ